MGKIKTFITKTFIDTTDLDLAHQEIGHLRELCDKQTMIINYQKELLDTQGESIRLMRKQLIDMEKLKEEIKEIRNDRETTGREHNTRKQSTSKRGSRQAKEI